VDPPCDAQAVLKQSRYLDMRDNNIISTYLISVYNHVLHGSFIYLHRSLRSPRSLPSLSIAHLNTSCHTCLSQLLSIPSILRWDWASNLFLSSQSLDTYRPVTPNQILRCEAQITACLEDTTCLESPRYFTTATSKEEPHLERITNNPVDNNAGSEAFAPASLVISQELRERERSLNSQRNHTQQIRVRDENACRRHDQVQHQQHAGKVGDECPIGSRRPPLPEVVWAVRHIFMLEGEVRGRRSVRKRDMEEEQMDAYHEESLDEQRGAEVGAEPVVDFQDAGDEHDERDVEGEAGRAAGSVHAVDLVAIAGDWTCCYAAGGALEAGKGWRIVGAYNTGAMFFTMALMKNMAMVGCLARRYTSERRWSCRNPSRSPRCSFYNA
jgi:hypothetical protein